MCFYLTQWLPSSARAGLYSLFFLAVPLSSIVGSPISAKIMEMNGARGLAGWQWLFLLEAVPAVVLGALVPLILTPSPAVAKWLSAEEKDTLAVAMAADEAAKPVVAKDEPLPVGTIGVGAGIYFFYAIGLYALGFWVPRLLTSHGVKLAMRGLADVAAVRCAGAVGMYCLERAGRTSTNERRSEPCRSRWLMGGMRPGDYGSLRGTVAVTALLGLVDCGRGDFCVAADLLGGLQPAR